VESEKLPQLSIFLGDLASGGLDVNRGAYTLEVGLTHPLLEFLEIFPSPRARTALVVSDAAPGFLWWWRR
jgi:hypothetical protein